MKNTAPVTNITYVRSNAENDGAILRLTMLQPTAATIAPTSRRIPRTSTAPSPVCRSASTTTPATDKRLNSVCQTVGRSRRKIAANASDAIGISAIITPENVAVEYKIPYVSQTKYMIG
ncbi:MAG: hypothetical protein BWY81_00538 [Firmicutes bacterium ADurb.Bin467]|nr:MAG: hypothetical protein BWY81_00538 [Firmicutes bacterium ADurb.Bin467]